MLPFNIINVVACR